METSEKKTNRSRSRTASIRRKKHLERLHDSIIAKEISLPRIKE